MSACIFLGLSPITFFLTVDLLRYSYIKNDLFREVASYLSYDHSTEMHGFIVANISYS